MTQPFRDQPKLAKSVHTINKILTGLVFLAYPLLLGYLLRARERTLYLSIVVPLDGFIIVSFMRRIINRPRPYEKFGFSPAIPKDTKGRSFPSRHVFSAAVIAVTFLVQGEPALVGAGVFLLLCALMLGVLRVLSGVHYISDVLGALVCAGIGWASYCILL
ncbi:MAG: phosphatase PAP2 family protein [Muribaculaceae bacterium]|nr:phosphatase PAP2 family protein [Roseburia sp.]MCM1431506.1 phosphatase PAP2 family protein [Muribaculaceae bacterium]MCM1493799.1 phosphatase PAP2 family protein [Muribaculaceae bacterium]